MKRITKPGETPGSGFREGRRGKACRGGKLYVFAKGEVVVVRGGERPAAWARTAKRPTWFSSPKLADAVISQVVGHPQRPASQPIGRVGAYPVLTSGQLCFRFYHPSDLAVAQFRQTIPPPILDRLARFRDRRWQLYNLMARCPGAADLVDGNPALAFALANSRAFHPVSRPWDSARRLVRRRQRDILGWLGFTPSEQARRILSKIPATDLYMERLFRLKRLLQRDPEATLWLSHLPRLPGDILDALAFYRGAMSMPLLLSLLEADRRGDSDVIWLGAANAIRKGLGLPWPVLRSEAAIVPYYEELDKRATLLKLVQGLPNELPPPPALPPLACGIRPITTVAGLIAQGERARNCSPSYARSVHAGNHYLYQVQSPVSATLSLIRSESGEWVPGQVLGTANTPIDEGLVDLLFSRVLGTPLATLVPALTPVSETPFD